MRRLKKYGWILCSEGERFIATIDALKAQRDQARRNNEDEIRRLGLRQLEWDKNEGDTPFHSTNAVIDRHNREIVSAYKKARREALEEAAKYFEGHGCSSGWYRSNIVANIRALSAKEKE